MGKKTKDGKDNIRDLDGPEDRRNEKVQPWAAEKKKVDLGLDISTSVIGMCAMNADGTFEKMGHVKLNTVPLQKEGMFGKVDEAMKEISEFIAPYSLKKIYIEMNAMMYSMGASSAATLFTLAKMNAIISYECYRQFQVPVVPVNVTSARSKIGYKDNRSDKRSVKEKVREFVFMTNPSLPIKTHIAKTGSHKGLYVIDKEVYDEIDAFVIVKGGQLIT